MLLIHRHLQAINIDFLFFIPELNSHYRGLYKRYEVDESVPVPNRTKNRHNQQPNIQQQGSNAEEDCLFPMCIHDNSPPENLGNEFENDYNGAPIREKCIAVLAYMNKMKLTSTAFEQLLRLLKFIGGVEDMDKLTTKSLRSSFSNIHPSIRHTDYCSKCGAHFSVEEDVFTCWTDGCDELRYAGPRNMQHQKKLKCYFATVLVGQQL